MQHRVQIHKPASTSASLDGGGGVCPGVVTASSSSPFRSVLFSRQPVVCGVGIVFVRCICVVWAEIHWMYPPNSPRGRASPRGQLSLDECCWRFLSQAALCLCVCVCLPAHLPSLLTHTHTSAEFKCRCQVFSLNKAQETIIYWPCAALSVLCGL